MKHEKELDPKMHIDLFQLLDALVKAKKISRMDLKFGHWLSQKINDASDVHLLLSVILSQDLSQGHVCLDLTMLDMRIEKWPNELRVLLEEVCSIDNKNVLDKNELANQSDRFSRILLDNTIIGDGSVVTPLVLDKHRLYFYRYWQYECLVAKHFLNSSISSASQNRHLIPVQKLKQQLDYYFASDETPDWQRIAAAVTVDRKLNIISGGPGTGKTTTVTKLLAIYIENKLIEGKNPIIELAAPTGKAAARLSESIAEAKGKLEIPNEVLKLIPEQGKTIHRLLGVRGKSNRFIHDRHTPLLADLVIVDEASMIDLPMMASLVYALSSETHLVLIGDRDQLASVEAGSVLGDICDSPLQHCYSTMQTERLVASCGFPVERISPYAFSDSVAFLKKSYRFSKDSGIGVLAKACNQGDAEQAASILTGEYKDLRQVTAIEDQEQLLTYVLEGYSDYFTLIREECSSEKMFNLFNEFQILCALRVGFFGVENINSVIEKYFEKQGIKSEDNRWYVGRPVMITRNDNQMQLYNGDIGVTNRDDQTGQMKVWFEQGGEMRGVLPSRLPQHESVFAMTVHKSQGSEFNHVMFFLSSESKVVNKELIYTAITRAKNKFSYYGLVSVLKQAIRQSTKRTSGLADRIWHQ